MEKLNALDDLNKMIFVYRYLSLILSTIVYGLLVTVSGSIPKAVVLIGMLLSCALVTYLYFLTESDRHRFQIILFLEVVANCFFVIISGGFSSPYIWYTMSSVLMTAALYEKEHTAVVASCYLFSGTIGAVMKSDWQNTVLTNSLLGIGYLLLLYGMLSLTIQYMEKMDMNRMREQLVISEERNRMANHIHDTVLQKLFAVSCSIFALESKTEGEQSKEDLSQIKASLDETMTELREAIYGIDWSRSNSLKERLKSYLDEIGQLHSVNIGMEIDDGVEHLSDGQKTAIYRIVCEAVNNGVRHGEADKIQVGIHGLNHHFTVEIGDNGKGFASKQQDDGPYSGNGLRNIQQLTEYLKGSLRVQPNKENGVTMEIDFAIR